MNLTELLRLRSQFISLVILGFLLTPIAGIGGAYLYGLADAETLGRVMRFGLLPAFFAVLLVWSGIHFRRYLGPFILWLLQPDRGRVAPNHLHRRLSKFTREYWSLYLLYGLATPLVYAYSVHGHLQLGSIPAFSNMLVLQFAAGILIGLPVYLVLLDRLGRLVGHLGLDEVQVSLKSRMMLLVGFVPLLSYSILMHYHWLQTRQLTVDLLLIWGTLAAVTATVTWLSIRSMAQALQPVQEVLSRTGASTHNELAELRPQSTDEIGYLTQTLGKLFGRLGDQESHMRSVVETAAEGIVVTDEVGNIDTFNSAAERLFGYLALEIRGRPLSRILPSLMNADGSSLMELGEQEITGQHRNGNSIPVSVRASEMRISGRRMFTYLVADITKRKSAESQLKSAEARYRDLVETAHDLVWSVDASGYWTYLNRACKAIYGREPHEIVSTHIDDVQSPDYAERNAAAFAEILKGEDLVQYETVHLDANGRPHYLSFNARAHLDEAGKVMHISGTARDITEQKIFENKLTYQAEHDSLTGLFNRHYFQQELERTVARVARSGSNCALFYIDLDQFKYINDTLGHAAGDKLLTEISTLVTSHVREGDLFARFGGDEFTLLLYNIVDRDVFTAAEHFRALFENYKFFYDNKTFNVTSSIGVALIDNGVASADEIMSHADLACNMAKAQGRNRINLYNPDESNKAGMAEDMGWAARVRQMLEEDRFKLVYQPIVSVADGEVHDYEVLVRMVCDDGEIIMPGGFMPAAERFGLIHSVDRWIVRRAIRQLSDLRAQGNQVCFSINLSGRAFEDDTLLPMVQQELRETGLDPSWLTFEITETAAIANLSAAEKFIRALKGIGCQFALDDFGSGFCSFTYLKHLPVDKLKIDGSFVQGLAQTNVDQAMVESMNQVAHALGKQTIAEYVENAATLELLRKIGVDYAQGNYIGRPREALMNLARPVQAISITTLP